MSGIYIHIPFCDQACHYCDFHFSTTFQKYRHKLLKTIQKELFTKLSENVEKIETIYFGGGTPSVLCVEELKEIMDVIQQTSDVSEDAEVTLEANPNHLTSDYLKGLKSIGVNRLSIGIQSFHDEVLEKLNRNHDSLQAKEVVQRAQKEGFDNITVDLIYGIPFQTDEQLEHNLVQISSLGIDHVSAYQLTIEENTVFGRWKDRGKLLELSDEKCLNQFKMVKSYLEKEGYEQYEVSNYARNGKYSRHNSSYWKGVKYFGIGPGAHEFDGEKRSWNVSNNTLYIENNKVESEELSRVDSFNEKVLLGLRQLKVGIDREELKEEFPYLYQKIDKDLSDFISKGELIEKDSRVLVSEIGIFIIDYITSELFIIHED